ncbi:hypothetical protein [Chondromyces apiculatus]|uniref:Uncharacterized protein n=1 Tax=Chondromyces apiculatus DSM 436 TaxID=1192034 RepID=A0A017T1M4_9BACT|nr:hypothetical protein [Chondromyces apiculatus]EYF02750.1 Hypothetical protein CAP_6485 [Chondromyces apiculatus DSM 436]
MTDQLSERETRLLERFSMRTQEIRHRQGVEVHQAMPPDLATDAELPGHSRHLLRCLNRWALRWASPDGVHSGGIAPTCAQWGEDGSAYRLPPGKTLMELDAHVDGCRAFFVRDAGAPVDSACVMATRAGGEGEALKVGETLADYLEAAVEHHFAAGWPTDAARAQEAVDWLTGQPFESQFEVRVAALENATAAGLRALRLRWLNPRSRRSIAVALKLGGSAGSDLVLLERALRTPRTINPGAAKDIAYSLILGNMAPEDTHRFFIADEPPADTALVVLDVTRVGTAFLRENERQPPAQHLLQLLLDAPGAEQLLATVDAQRVRFSEALPAEELAGVVLDTFVAQREFSLPRGKVPGQIQVAAVLPRALIPTGCVPDAVWTSVAPANDGRTPEGSVLKSA